MSSGKGLWECPSLLLFKTSPSPARLILFFDPSTIYRCYGAGRMERIFSPGRSSLKLPTPLFELTSSPKLRRTGRPHKTTGQDAVGSCGTLLNNSNTFMIMGFEGRLCIYSFLPGSYHCSKKSLMPNSRSYRIIFTSKP